MNVINVPDLVYNLVEEVDGDSDYGSDMDSCDEKADAIFERIDKY